MKIILALLSLSFLSGCAIGSLSIGPEGEFQLDLKLPQLGNEE